MIFRPAQLSRPQLNIKKKGCFIFHPPVNVEEMESHRSNQNQRVFRTLYLLLDHFTILKNINSAF